VKTLPTVIAAPNKNVALEVLEFQAADRIPNRDALGFYFYVRLAPGEPKSRVAVVFSGTVYGVELEAFGLPGIADPVSRFRVFAEGAIGDYLCEHGLPSFTPSGVPAAQIECFSPHFQSWADRAPASDETIEEYLRSHVFWAWKFSHGFWELGSSDYLRLHQPLSTVQRLIQMNSGQDWTVTPRPEESPILTPLPAFLRMRHATTTVDRRALATKDAAVSPTSNVNLEPSTYVYVDETRLADLKRLSGSKYDLRKLLVVCEELNVCYRSQCYHAVAALTRTVLDYVPPLLGMNTFTEIANNYDGGKSFRECMQRLEGAARTIADAHLHARARPKDSLPSRTQVNFSNELDMLLAEIVRVLSIEKDPPTKKG
jgi:hypothetical protein